MNEQTLVAHAHGPTHCLAEIMADHEPNPQRGYFAPRISGMSSLALAEGIRSSSAWREWDGVVILNAGGCITFCSTAAAQLLGVTADDLVGQQVTAFIPELPFGRYIPEFNLAYVFFHGDDGVWARRALKTRNGKRIPLDVSLGSTDEIGNRSIVLILKQAAALAADDAG